MEEVDLSAKVFHLWNAARQCSAFPNLASHYIHEMRVFCDVEHFSIPLHIRATYCPKCSTPFIPGNTCSFRAVRWGQIRKNTRLSALSLKNALFRLKQLSARPFSRRGALQGLELKQPKSDRVVTLLRCKCAVCNSVTCFPLIRRSFLQRNATSDIPHTPPLSSASERPLSTGSKMRMNRPTPAKQIMAPSKTKPQHTTTTTTTKTTTAAAASASTVPKNTGTGGGGKKKKKNPSSLKSLLQRQKAQEQQTAQQSQAGSLYDFLESLT